jgi:hypothetical protein
MTMRAALHRLIEERPESELVAAERFLRDLRDMADPVRRALLSAPWDDEPETEEERQPVQEARDELARRPDAPQSCSGRRLAAPAAGEALRAHGRDTRGMERAAERRQSWRTGCRRPCR